MAITYSAIQSQSSMDVFKRYSEDVGARVGDNLLAHAPGGMTVLAPFSAHDGQSFRVCVPATGGPVQLVHRTNGPFAALLPASNTLVVYNVADALWEVFSTAAAGVAVAAQTRHTLMTIALQVENPVFNVTVPDENYNHEGDADIDLLASQALFNAEELITVTLNGTNVKTNVTWLSSTTFSLPGTFDVGDEVEVIAP